MSTFIFPSQNTKPDSLTDEYGRELKLILAQQCTMLTANTPYCLEQSPQTHSIQRTLTGLNIAERDKLMCTMDVLDQRLLAIAELYDKALSTIDLQQTGSLVGAGATASHARLTGFQKAIVDYQRSLLALSEHSKSKVNGRPANAKKALLKAAVQRSYKHLQQTYQTELKKIVTPAEWGKNRGSALSSAQRGINVASRRKYRQLNIQNGQQAIQLAKLTKGINFAGNGLIALDAGLRANTVRNSYINKQDWQRELAVQTTGFGAGGAAGLAAGRLTASALAAGAVAIGLSVTPIGWVIIIGAALTVGYIAANEVDKAAQKAAGNIYDKNLLEVIH